MNLNISRVIFDIFFTLCIIISGVFAFVDNSPAGIDRKLAEEHRTERYNNRALLQNTFESSYHLRSQDKDGIIRFEPLLLDYSFFLNFYADGTPMSPNMNPIRPYELHRANFYFDSSALFPKTREQVFTDFFTKYNAAFGFLHFWITRFVIKHTIPLVPDDKKNISQDVFLQRCDEMAFYAYWMLNLEIDRHLDELDSKLLSAVPNSRHFQKVIPAFETVVRTLKCLIEVEPFISRELQRLFKFDQKSNPFNERIKPIQFTPQDEMWMKIILFVENLKMQKKTYVHPENVLKIMYNEYDGTIRTEHAKDPKKYMMYLHDYSWSAIKIILGRELYILESFFYSTLTGIHYPLADSFIKPNFLLYTKNLWKKIECLYLFWNPATARIYATDETCENSNWSHFFKMTEQPNKIDLAIVLRELDDLRFRSSSYADYQVFGADFTLKTCQECLLKCQCYGGFRMLDNKKSSSSKVAS